MRYLAIDYGQKRTGLAICDPDEIICSPLEVINSPAGLIDKILQIIKSYQVQAVIIGLPLNMDGSQGQQAKITRQFAQNLKTAAADIPIYFQDERLSSYKAHDKIADAQFTNKKKKKRIDAIAAAEILRAFLDSRTNNQ